MEEEAPFPADPEMPHAMTQQEIINTMREMFPWVDLTWLERRARPGVPMEHIIEQLLHPRRNRVPMGKFQRSSVRRRNSVETSSSQESMTGYGYGPTSRCAETKLEILYSVHLLCNKYPKLSLNHIRSLLSICDNNYFAAAMALKNHVESENFVYPKSNEPRSFVLSVKRAHNRTDNIIMVINKTVRKEPYDVPETLPDWLQVQKNMVEEAPVEDLANSSKHSNRNIECPICVYEVSMDITTICSFGHIFCRECVQSYIKENVYGQAKASLACMEIECEGEFEMGEVRKFIDRDTWKKLNERKDEEALLAINSENVERCPYCNYAVIMEVSKEENKVFKCGRSRCQAEICRVCGKDWDRRHMGVKCEILKRNTEKAKRKEYEEKMALTVIRHCHHCKLPLSMEGGCNLMKCTCGATLCYLCRTPDITYDHFCRHPRSPGKRCPLCSNCFLWEDAERTDRIKLRQLQKEANAKLPPSAHFSLDGKSNPRGRANRPNDHRVNVDGDGNRIEVNVDGEWNRDEESSEDDERNEDDEWNPIIQEEQQQGIFRFPAGHQQRHFAPQPPRRNYLQPPRGVQFPNDGQNQG